MEYFKQSLKLTLACIIVFSVLYPLLLWSFGRFVSLKAEGTPVSKDGRIIGFENIGQNFDNDKYFYSRPSAVNYDASSSGASNYGPSNPDFIKAVKARSDTFLTHNPDVKRNEIPIDLLTTSGSGLDPDISYEAAKIQVPRISRIRNIDKTFLYNLVDRYVQKPFLGLFGKSKVNVLKLNLTLDSLDNKLKSAAN
jgi:potassium-transporting ATPase KdpC subunit